MNDITVRVSAPGRVNLIGEHTDYNGGFVLPMAIPQRTVMEMNRLPGLTARLRSADIRGPEAVFEYELGKERKSGRWGDYMQGVTRILAGEGRAIGGFEARIRSDVPIGSGLSSSAAFEVCAMRGLRDLFGLKLGDLEIARLGQRVENEFVGARVGIMDQMASSLCDGCSALFIDTLDLSHKKVAIPPGADIAVINSGVSHSNAGGDYNTRRSECERACEALGVKLLREIGPDKLSAVQALPEPLNRRARHVVTENERVLLAVEAIENGDLKELGRLFCQSHASMRDDYQVSVPQIDLLVELAMAQPGVLGARLTGGGFGGSIVVLAEKGRGRAAAKAVVAAYERKTPHKAAILVDGGDKCN